MPYSVTNDVKTYYEVSGEGFPLMMVHANPFDRRMFIYQVAHLSNFFKVINIDLRGYGYSDKPVVPITITDLCDDVIGVCRQEKAREALFLGVSVGGVMGLQLGVDHPELFKALILVGCSSMPGDRYRAASMATLKKELPGSTSSTLRISSAKISPKVKEAAICSACTRRWTPS